MRFRLFFLILSLMSLFISCTQSTEQVSTEWKMEPYRPQLHFSPKTGWMNDPNGMVYYGGEYHLFYQHYPDSTVWGPMHWGHAVSKDLVHWKHLPIALYPDKLGYIFSGSAVIDWNNTSGFGQDGKPAMIAIFTLHDMEGERGGKNNFQTQGIAYSLDNGRTWIMYDQNPVISNPGIRDFRDPKVSWLKDFNKWVMTLAVQNHVEFYFSDDLKHWGKLSEFGKDLGNHNGVWECPDLFPIKDDTGNTKWVLFVSIGNGGPQGGSATQYFIGDFDGTKFTPQDSTVRWIDYGADNYAGVTWSDIPDSDGRRLFIGWMSNWQYAQIVPTKSWRSAMTLPRAISLYRKNSIYEIKSYPVRELNSIQTQSQEFIGQASYAISEGSKITIQDSIINDLQLNLSNGLGDSVTISIHGDSLTFDRSHSGVVDFHEAFSKPHSVNLSTIAVHHIEIWIDASSIEIFINKGERVLTELIFPRQPFSQAYLKKTNPIFSITKINSTLH